STHDSRVPSCWPSRTPCVPATVKGFWDSAAARRTGPELSKGMAAMDVNRGVACCAVVIAERLSDIAAMLKRCLARRMAFSRCGGFALTVYGTGYGAGILAAKTLRDCFGILGPLASRETSDRPGSEWLSFSRRGFLKSLSRTALVLPLRDVLALAQPLFRQQSAQQKPAGTMRQS